MIITGSTRIFYCIADPIAQVRAPELYNTLFDRHGVDAVMVPMQVKAEHLMETLRALFASPSVGGAALSIPHKAMGARAVGRVTREASVAGAVNAIRRGEDGALEGALFDGLGFARSLDRYGIDISSRRVLIIGAGGAASALTAALADRGCPHIALFDPDRFKAEQLARNVLTAYPACRIEAVESNDPAKFDLVINASPLGLNPDDLLPVPVHRLNVDAFVYDILMKGQPTPLLRAVGQRGIRGVPGFDMLVQQAGLYLNFFGFPELANVVAEEEAALRQLLEESHQLD
ncbi:Shikimate dehydrogenase [Burkholderia sp. 8Y]|uniref:shikimate dehydrogenase family protein n=1 Tax=Burkholderia sp. 8Y TaxID=2653133 RepID=UPI0012EFBA46|nr:shikimate dehydrogenase [Burkholderia sp. 8Y]VXC90669.1 Shikimate dehydrogenase [Burkholderia sp. 8Y]